MEGYIGEIRLFAANFQPRNWAYCAGQIINIASNTALFSILGNNYGGNGTSTFALPDLRGRSAVGAGDGIGLSPYALGARTGFEQITLTNSEMPAHIHPVVTTAGTGGGATTTLIAVNENGNSADPGGNFIAKDGGAGASGYASSGTLVAMKAGAVIVDQVNAPLPSVSIGATGGNMPHSNLQPLLSIYYIICQYGTFPPRS